MAKEGKFFSLIHGGDIRLAKGNKIIAHDDVSAVLDAQEMLDKVRADAERYQKEVSDECEELKKQAFQEGFEKGHKEWVEQLTLLEKRRRKVREEMEEAVIPIAIKAAKKIVGEEIALDKEIIIKIVSNALKSVSQHKKIIIYVNREDREILDENKPKLKELFEQLESLSIQERSDVERGGCVIETEAGIINARLENQWRRLEAAFQKVMKQRS